MCGAGKGASLIEFDKAYSTAIGESIGDYERRGAKAMSLNSVWNWFWLSMSQCALFFATGCLALHYRGKWIKEKSKNRKESRQ